MGFSMKCRCPSCFKEITIGKCPIVSKTGVSQPKGPFAPFRVPSLVGPAHTLGEAHRQCYECDYDLPYNIEDVHSLTIAIVGDTSSGKSHFIAALLHQLQTDWMRKASGYVQMYCLTTDVENYYKQDYFEPFKKRQTLQPTLAVTPGHIDADKAFPLIYEMSWGASPKHPPTRMNLMIYDTAGENFSRDRLTEYAQFVLNANAFIFVADPFAMQPITDDLDIPYELRTQWQLPFQKAQNRMAVQRLTDVIYLVQRYRGNKNNASFGQTPVAVMLSKSDVLKHVQGPPRLDKRTFTSNPAYGSSLMLSDIESVNNEVRAILTHYDQENLISATARFRQVGFFATSATGTIPDIQMVTPPQLPGTTSIPTPYAVEIFPSVNPLRCLDPFLWILYCLKVVKGK